MGNGEMSISAFAKRTLLSIKALRLYDDMGLLRPDRIDASSGYRYYSDSQVSRARLISYLRKLNVPLNEIAVVLDLAPADASRELARWWTGEEAQFERRRDLLNFIRRNVLKDADVHDGESERYEIRVRVVPEATFLHESSHVHGPELPEFINHTSAALNARALRYGGSRAHEVVIYHGVVDLDNDGPVEVCLQVPAGSIAADDDLIRTESAHMQAYVLLQKHQVAFPQILQVYQALRRWIDTHGYAPAGPPREIYLEDFVLSSHDELICEVAYPIIRIEGQDHE